jgi:hypothetical protein
MIASCFRTISHQLFKPITSSPPTFNRVYMIATTRPFTTGSRKMQANGTMTPRSRSHRPDIQISQSQDDAAIRSKYRPFILDERVAKSDWISKLELDTIEDMVQADLAANNGERLRVLVLYGSLRARYPVLFLNRSYTH